MVNQPQQRFCTNCGQPLAPGVAFCVTCGAQVGAQSKGVPGQVSTGGQPGYPPSYGQSQDDPLLASLAAGYVASRQERNPPVRARRPGSRLRGCGCLLLVLVVLAGPFIGVALTSGRPRQIFSYVAGGIVIIIILLLLIAMLATRRGREALVEGGTEGCLDAILGGFLGG